MKKQKSDNGAEQFAEASANRTLADMEADFEAALKGKTENVLRLGAIACEIKESGLVPHGELEDYFRKKFKCAPRTVQKWMQADRYITDRKPPPGALLLQTRVLYALASGGFKPVAEEAILQEAQTQWIDEERAHDIADTHEPDPEAIKAFDDAFSTLMGILETVPHTKLVGINATESECCELINHLENITCKPDAEDDAVTDESTAPQDAA
jgi:hypothetical protein